MKTTNPVKSAPEPNMPFWEMSIMLSSSMNEIPVGFLSNSGNILAKAKYTIIATTTG
uniref:Uncharacterized protein n=1 Tax=viral metagenome TaxID=1070528 RepID=A0A6C0CMZ2_9ZZZZ